jgi:hypothetical protein
MSSNFGKVRAKELKTQRLVVTLLLLFLFIPQETAIAQTNDAIKEQIGNSNSKQKTNLQVTQNKQLLELQRQKKDYDHESNELITKTLYRRLANLSILMSPTGANSINVDWENNKVNTWYIEAQQNGEGLIIGGLIKNDEQAIQAGFKMFDWGFAHQSADGGFQGTGDPFHSTSFFVQAVAHTLLFIQQSPQASKYAVQVARYKRLLHLAARWMILPDAWEKGTRFDKPYTHRRYLVAAALGLTSQLTGDQELIDYARQSIKDGLASQRLDGVNPEKGGYDSSYQMVGVVYAQRWVTYFPDDPLTPKVVAMIEKAMAWEQTRVLASGKINIQGNTRTAGQESTRTGILKTMDYRAAIRGFAYWASVTDNPKWAVIARQIAQFYYHLS